MTAEPQRRVEAERLLESDLAPDLSQHALSPLGRCLGIVAKPLEQFPAQVQTRHVCRYPILEALPLSNQRLVAHF